MKKNFTVGKLKQISGYCKNCRKAEDTDEQKLSSRSCDKELVQWDLEESKELHQNLSDSNPQSKHVCKRHYFWHH